MKTLIFDIEKFATKDGPGIRTVVFLKGCPLRCPWCHNPESQSASPELFFSPALCIGCGRCVAVCPNGCHKIADGKHVFDRTHCTVCGKCAGVCPVNALENVGQLMSVDEVLGQVLADKVFYETSGGGMTLSGGEPLSQFEFVKALLTAAKKAGIHTCVETCGFAPARRVRALLPLVDLWLWDVKAPPERHQKLTGVDNRQILKNLHMIDDAGAQIILRCPMIPGLNDDEAALIQIADLANSLKGCQRIDIEPYHPLGESKNVRLGRGECFRAAFPAATKIAEYQRILSAHTHLAAGVP